ncbi:hypothetical protein Aperf_G00000019111 [Anoplocephala perfoliata]
MAVHASEMLVRQAILAHHRALNEFAARTVSLAAVFNSRRNLGTHTKDAKPKVLITGGLGQLGMPLARALRSKFGEDSVVLTDIKKPDPTVRDLGHFEFADIMDVDGMRKLIAENRVDWLIHFSVLLSEFRRANIEVLHNIARDRLRRLLLDLSVQAPTVNGAFFPTDSER